MPKRKINRIKLDLFDGQKLKLERQKLKLTQTELAKNMTRILELPSGQEISQQLVNSWEHELSEPQFSNSLALCQFFNTDIFYWIKKRPKKLHSSQIERASCEFFKLTQGSEFGHVACANSPTQFIKIKQKKYLLCDKHADLARELHP